MDASTDFDQQLELLERQLIPLLNSVRARLGKAPVIVPKPRLGRAAADWRVGLPSELGPYGSWVFVLRHAKVQPPEIPSGYLGRLTKQALRNLALDYGYQTTTLSPRKEEFVEALGWLREWLGSKRG